MNPAQILNLCRILRLYKEILLRVQSIQTKNSQKYGKYDLNTSKSVKIGDKSLTTERVQWYYNRAAPSEPVQYTFWPVWNER